MKKKRAKTIIKELEEQKYLHNEEAIDSVYSRIDEELEKELEELNEKSKELISIIHNHIISLDPNLV